MTDTSKRSLYWLSIAIGAGMWFVMLAFAFLEHLIMPIDVGLLPLLQRMFSSPAGLLATCAASVCILWGILGLKLVKGTDHTL
jgi:hypothetical protein